MNCNQTTADTIDATKGQTICRASDWQDVARFFLLNYGLHVFTALLPPGTSGLGTLREYFLSLTIPIYGITESCEAILNCARRERDELQTALKSGALCMVVPGDESTKGKMISSRAMIHGQFPAAVWNKSKDTENGANTPRWCLRIVPKSFTVIAPIGPPAVPLQLSCNYSFLSAAAGIIQVLSGSMEIYHAWERQIPQFGYAAYSLTVVPYLFMSVVNLIGCMCQPQYPAMFLVRYCGPNAPMESSTDDDQVKLLPLREDGTEQSEAGGNWTQPELGGTVGAAYGDLSDIDDKTTNLFSIYNYGFLLLVAVAPYVVIATLTGFRSANSTLAQRTWIILWLVSGQGCILIVVILTEFGNAMGFMMKGGLKLAFGLVAFVLAVCAVVICAFGGFMVVAQMIQNDKMCIRV